MKTLLTMGLFVTTLFTSCSRDTSQTARLGEAQKPDATQREKADHALQKQVEQIASAAGGRVGVMALVLETAESDASAKTLSLNARARFPMQSVYKLPISMAVMHQIDAGKIQLDHKVMITKSDFIRQGQHSPIRDKYLGGTELKSQ